MRGNFGIYGRPLRMFEMFLGWQERQLALMEAGELQEADSKADFPEFLFGPVSRAMWGGYNRRVAQYERYAAIQSVNDFRETRLRGLNALRGVGYVGDHGEYPAMRRTEKPVAGIAVDTYGGVYAITRQAIVNDDTGQLLNDNPRDMGRAIARFIGETIIALIESNPTAPDGNPFFSVARGNQVTDALSENSLANAISFGEGQVDDDGDKIVVTYTRLVVKTAIQELIARRIINSQLTGATANDTATTVFDKGTLNAVEGIIPANGVIREPWFNDANDWYLFADPDEVPAFALAFLNGRREPFVGLKNPEVRNAMGPGVDPYTFELDSVDFKVRHDFGTAAYDPRGAFRGVVA
jgi:hypothetical protein